MPLTTRDLAAVILRPFGQPGGFEGVDESVRAGRRVVATARSTARPLTRPRGSQGRVCAMGHPTTLDIYGHLMPGSEDEAAGLLDTYLEAQRQRAEEAARAA